MFQFDGLSWPISPAFLFLRWNNFLGTVAGLFRRGTTARRNAVKEVHKEALSLARRLFISAVPSLGICPCLTC